MICETASFKRGLAPPQEDLPRPTWTSLTVDGIQLTNSVEAAGWNELPCELAVCELCWDYSCAMQNYSLIKKLADWLVCFPPDLSEFNVEWKPEWFNKSRFLQHVLLFRPSLWKSMGDECNSLPPIDNFSEISRSQLVQLWLHQLPGDDYEQPNRERLHYMMKLLLASDPLTESESEQRIESLLAWVDESPESKVLGRVIEVKNYSGELNVLHFDGNPSPEWTCMTSESNFAVVLDSNVVFEIEE